MPRSPALAVLACLTLTVPLAAQGPPPGRVLDEVFATWQSAAGPGCTVGLDYRGERTTRAYGMADLEHGLALTPGSVLESGSVAKQFTAAAVMALVQQGKLSLEDDIRKHLPEVPDFGATITIRHLLQHTSGLRDQWALLGLQGFPPGQEVHDFARIRDLVAHQQRLNFAPGAEYLYSNTGYSLTAMIVAKVAGKSFAAFSREVLFGPLGMPDTQWRDDYRRVVPGRAVAYSRTQDGWLQNMPFTNVHGNGGLLTTVADLLTWNKALTSGVIPGGAEAVRVMETPGRLTDGSEISYALGLGVDRFRGVRMVGHGGATAGYRTYLARVPERDYSVAILCNAAQANADQLVQQVTTRLLELPAAEVPPGAAVAINAADLQRFVGAYRDSTTDQTLTFALAGDTLTVRGGGPAGTRLVHLGNQRFWAAGPGELRFEGSGDRLEVVQFANAWRRYQRADAAPATVRVADYLGSYRSPELDVTYRVENANGSLVFAARPDTRMTLASRYRDGFAAGNGATLRFVRDRSGRVTGLRVFAGRARDVYFERLADRR